MHSSRLIGLVAAGIWVGLVGCGSTFGEPASDDDGTESTGSGDASDTGDEADGTSTESDSTGETGETGETGDPEPDLPTGMLDVPPPEDCSLPEAELTDIPDCAMAAGPGEFDPVIEWEWDGGPDGDEHLFGTPLVANLTDDNDDGKIDTCDDPDVVVIAGPVNCDNCVALVGRLYVLDGATGQEHFKITTVTVDPTKTPAIGDIDDDGVPDIVAIRSGFWGAFGDFVAFEADGTEKWKQSGDKLDGSIYGTSTALADLDNDGDVEILAAHVVADHQGKILWKGQSGIAPAPMAADLDGDGDLEVILGHAAYHHDGSVVFEGSMAGEPHVANLDDDPEPEILVISNNQSVILEHDGTQKLQIGVGGRRSFVADVTGDAIPEFGNHTDTDLELRTGDGMMAWASVIGEDAGRNSSAFDFLGDGTPEILVDSLGHLGMFDGEGASVFQQAHTGTPAEHYGNPVVADVDGDGSAEILVPNIGGKPLTVIGDADDRWMPARRIWNQRTYHVTNVHEDGRIPQYEPPHFELLNTMHTQAQVEDGFVCRPAGE